MREGIPDDVIFSRIRRQYRVNSAGIRGRSVYNQPDIVYPDEQGDKIRGKRKAVPIKDICIRPRT